MKDSRKKQIKNLAIALVAALCILGGLLAARWGLTLRDPQNLADFQEWIRSMGPGGWLALLAIQYVQIVIAFIPGGPIQIVAGALFGPVWGLATCMLGIVLATATVFALVQRFGHRVIALFVKEKELKEYKFLNDSGRLEFLVVLLFLIPGTPKDVLTYLFALTPIPMRRFLLLSMVARIPAALTSTLMGSSIADGNWLRALIYFLAVTAISLGGLAAHKKIMSYYHKRKR